MTIESGIEKTKNQEYNNNIEKLLENSECFFNPEKSFEQNDLPRLARLEKNFTKKEENKEWSIEEETGRCNLRKGMEKFLSSKNQEGVEKYWRNNENEYRDNFGRGRERESKDSFESLKHGILNEIIASKILKKISDFKFEMTNSEIDIYQKIDTLGYSDNEKMILAIQIKHGSIKNMGERGKKKSERELEKGIVQEVDNTGEELEKNKFFNGCSEFKEQFSLKDPNIVMKNIWIVIPSEYKIGEGGNYQDRLEKIILKRIEEIKSS